MQRTHRSHAWLNGQSHFEWCVANRSAVQPEVKQFIEEKIPASFRPG
jgi:hypothetical protein